MLLLERYLDFFFLSPKLKNTLKKNVWEVGEFWTGVLSHSEMPLLRICWKCWTSSWKLTDTTNSHFTEQLPASYPHFQLRPQHAMRSWPTSFSQPVCPSGGICCQTVRPRNVPPYIPEAAWHQQNFPWWFTTWSSCAHNEIQVQAIWDLET